MLFLCAIIVHSSPFFLSLLLSNEHAVTPFLLIESSLPLLLLCLVSRFTSQLRLNYAQVFDFIRSKFTSVSSLSVSIHCSSQLLSLSPQREEAVKTDFSSFNINK